MKDQALKDYFRKGSLGISRQDMPQIASKDVPDFLKWLNAKHGVTVKREHIKARLLSHTQNEIDPAKARAMIKDERSLKLPIIMSDDRYIIDGHHRHVAQYLVSPDYPTDVYRCNIGVEDLLEIAKTYPKTFSKALHEDFLDFLKRTEDCACGCGTCTDPD